MKRILLAAVTILALVTLAARLPAQQTGGVKSGADDSRYRWHEGRWWYWMPEGRWMVWTGSTWTPYEQSSICISPSGSGTAMPYVAGYGSYEASPAAGSYQPAFSGGMGYNSAYPGGSSAGWAGNYAGYGWTWGPGTAFRNSPGPRF